MDAKMRANFINSVAGSQKIPCPSCNTLNNAGSNFCITCGAKLESTPPTTSINENAYAVDRQKIVCPSCNTLNESDSSFCIACGTKLKNIVKKPEKKMAFNFVAPVVEEAEEPISVFAQGLPAWDIVPPQIMVRKKAKR